MQETKKTMESVEKIARLPRLSLNERQLYDLEMLLGGGFEPLGGFLKEDDYKSVVGSMRLQNGALWPIPVVLDVNKEKVEAKGINLSTVSEIILTDAFGNPLAFMKIESAYVPDKIKEVEMVYGSRDILHAGVKYVLNETEDIYIGGPVSLIQFPVHYDFLELRKTARELREELQKIKKDVIAFQTRNPMHRAHFHLIKSLSKAKDAHALIHPVVGPTKEGDIDYITRVKSYIALQQAYMPTATLALLPLAMRMAGPREALWHALIRKNYGATHFIVGRDHAGPGKDGNDKAFYGHYDAQKLALEHQAEMGITIVPSEELVYVKEIGEYVPFSQVESEHSVLSISGTKFRELLKSGEEIPEWFSFPEVIEALNTFHGKNTPKGKVILLTGLSGAGKSTIAGYVKQCLEEESGKEVTHLDGDVVRETLSKGLGFSKEDRIENIRRMGFVATEVARRGGVALISAIAPYRESRDAVRNQVEKNGGIFYEIFVQASLETLRQRDVKGLYKKAELGLIKGFTGVDSIYEEPEAAHLVVTTDKEEPSVSVRRVLDLIRR